jgi:hypothetical protein
MVKTLIFVLVILFLLGGMASIRRIEAGEVAVRVNLFTGSEQTIDTEGVSLCVPFLHLLHVIDSTPQTVTLQGEITTESFDTLPRLTVRAADGSNFWFDTMTVQYQVIPELAPVVLAEIGSGTDFRRWLQPTLRSILRDSLGTRSTMQVSDPTMYGSMKTEAMALLNERLNPHGVRIINIDTPLPHFVDEYENAIEERITTDNQSEVIRQELERAAATRQRELANMDQLQNRTYQERRAQLEGELATTLAQRQARLNDARADLTRTEGEGLALVQYANARATEVDAQWNATVEQVAARVQALSSTGREAVMRALAARIATVTIEVSPFQNDATPQTIRYESIPPLPR